MLFNTVGFFCFLNIVLAVHQRLGRRGQNRLLLVASYLFYAWWDWRFLALLVLSTVVDFAVARRLGSTGDDRARKWLLGVSVLVNLGVLGTFKYAGFFVESFADAMGGLGLDLGEPTLRLVLPVGVSFYTFQTLSYTIDVYRRRFEPTPDLVEFALFVSFFPQLVAGPILLHRPGGRHVPGIGPDQFADDIDLDEEGRRLMTAWLSSRLARISA